MPGKEEFQSTEVFKIKTKLEGALLLKTMELKSFSLLSFGVMNLILFFALV